MNSHHIQQLQHNSPMSNGGAIRSGAPSPTSSSYGGFLGIRPHETKMTKSVLQVNQRQGSPNLSPNNAQQYNPLRQSKESNFYFCAQNQQAAQPTKEKKKPTSTNFFKELTNSLYEGGGAVHPQTKNARQSAQQSPNFYSKQQSSKGSYLQSNNALLSSQNLKNSMISVNSNGQLRPETPEYQGSPNQPYSKKQHNAGISASKQMTQLKCKFQTPAMPGAGVASRPASNTRKKKEMAISNNKPQQQQNTFKSAKNSQQVHQKSLVPQTLSPSGKVYNVVKGSPVAISTKSKNCGQSPTSDVNKAKKSGASFISAQNAAKEDQKNHIFQRVYELKKKYKETATPTTASSPNLSVSHNFNPNVASQAQISSRNSQNHMNLTSKSIRGSQSAAQSPNSHLPQQEGKHYRPQSNLGVMQNNFFIGSSNPGSQNSSQVSFNYAQQPNNGSATTKNARDKKAQQPMLLEKDPSQKSGVSFISNNSHQAKVPNASINKKASLSSQNPREQILQHIGKYIKTAKKQEKKPQKTNESRVSSEESQGEEIIQNLREFLQYLEEKKIINSSTLQKDSDEMKNLIRDLMKLDLTKFQKPGADGSSKQARGASPQPISNTNLSASQQHANFGYRHNSVQADDQMVANAKRIAQNSRAQNYQATHSNNQTEQQNRHQQSDPKLAANSSNKSVPTIQLMINTNVNNFCIGAPSGQRQQQEEQQQQQQQQYARGSPLPPKKTTLHQQSPVSIGSHVSAPSSAMHQRRVSENVQKGVSSQSSLSNNNGLTSKKFSIQPQQTSSQQPIYAQSTQHKRTSSDIAILQQNNRLNHSRASQVVQAASQQQQINSMLQSKRSSQQSDVVMGPKAAKSNRESAGENKKIQMVQKPAEEEADVSLNDSVLQEREKLIKFIKAYIKKHNEVPPTTLDYYKFVKLIGKGAFGKVTLGVHKLTGKYVAIKTIDKSYMKDEYSRRKVFQEVYILKKIRHSCIIRLLEVFESPKHFLMVMEYAGGGDLLQYVKKRKRLDEETARAIFKQIVYGLGHCHCRSVLHRDIKLDNILMDGEGGIKLCDFGVSRLVKKNQIIKEQCGTPAYLCPEIIIDDGYEGFYADNWSLGVLLYAMVQGTVPFKANNIADLHKLILKGEFEFPYKGVSAEVEDLVRKMLVLTPEKRISITEILNHPWVKDDEEEEQDGEHDLKVGATFFREECLNGICGNNGKMEMGNINFINPENLYYQSVGEIEAGEPVKPQQKVTYSDYVALTEDFMTYRIDEEAIQVVESYGFPRKMVINSINKGEINHATCCYYLLIHTGN